MRAATAPGADPGAARREAAFLQIAQAAAIRRIAEGYVEAPPPATFRVIVNPLVTWTWIGALISLAGALIAVWPAPGARRRLVSSLYGARLGRGLSRA
jgi:cytochrome c-type biogenesis protein CcmF